MKNEVNDVLFLSRNFFPVFFDTAVQSTIYEQWQ